MKTNLNKIILEISRMILFGFFIFFFNSPYPISNNWSIWIIYSIILSMVLFAVIFTQLLLLIGVIAFI